MDFRLRWGPTLRYLRSFALYYFICLVNGVLFVWMEFCIKPRTQNVEFNRDDRAISKSFKPHELVSNELCLFISGGLAMGIITGYCVYGASIVKGCKKVKDVSKELHLWHVSMLALFLVLTTNGLITCCLKVVIGNPRPDFLARCQLDPAKTGNTFTIRDCLQPDLYTLYDGLRSTPSGHSSFAVSGLGYLYVWQCKFIVGDKKRYLWCPLLAALVMMTRVVDHKHHWYDLLCGTVVGGVSLLIGWSQLVRPNLLTSDSWQLPRPVTT